MTVSTCSREVPKREPQTNSRAKDSFPAPNQGRNAMDVLKETNAGNLGQKKAGKVRDIYDQGDKLILITTDRHSSFDRIIAHIPWKGQVLNQVSAWWFEQTKAIVSNQVLAVPDPNVMVVRKYKIVPIRYRRYRHFDLDPLSKRDPPVRRFKPARWHEKK
jgi:hypothetical protein